MISQLKNRLKTELPGIDSWREMIPGENQELVALDHFKPAAVLIALFPHKNSYKFPLIKRVEDGFAHGGQISLPGGGIDTHESATEAALRESNEEVGTPIKNIEIIGELSTLPIPVSGYLVHPIIGVMKSEPNWIPQESEVEEVFTVDVNQLFDENIIQSEIWNLRGNDTNIPFFLINNHKVWGATAMILNELKTLLKKFE